MRNLYLVEGCGEATYVLADSMDSAMQHWKQWAADHYDLEDEKVDEPDAMTFCDTEENILAAPRSK